MRKLITAILCVGLVLSMSATAFAATPSPTFDGFIHVQNSAVIKNDQVVQVNSSDVKVTSMYDSAELTEKESKQMAEAYDVLKKTEALDKAVPGLNDVLKNANLKITASDLAVVELVNVSVSNNIEKLLKDKDSSVVLTFDLDIKSADTVIVMCFVDGEWTVVPIENVTMNKDGSFSVKLETVGILAFAVQKTND